MMSPNTVSIYETAADTSGYIYFAKAVCREQWRLRPHFHDSVEITVVTKETCQVRVNAKEELLQPGTILFVDRFDVHDYRPDLGNEYYVVLVSSKYLDDTNGFLKKLCPPSCAGRMPTKRSKRFWNTPTLFGKTATKHSASALSTRFWAC